MTIRRITQPTSVAKELVKTAQGFNVSVLQLAPLLSNAEAAKALGFSPQTLRKHRSSGAPSPPYLRLGDGPKARVGYRPEDIKKWLDDRCFRHTSEEMASKAGPSGRQS